MDEDKPLLLEDAFIPDKNLSFLKKEVEKGESNKIPIPTPDFLKTVYSTKVDKYNPTRGTGALIKYEKEYDAYCKWSALPKDLRKPKKQESFELRWHLPHKYATTFNYREDFQERRLKYFWEWMMDKFPDVVHAIYKESIGKNMKAAQIFVDLISKHMHIDKPQVQVSPMMLVGVPQEKIDALFVPEGYHDIKDITPKDK